MVNSTEKQTKSELVYKRRNGYKKPKKSSRKDRSFFTEQEVREPEEHENRQNTPDTSKLFELVGSSSAYV